MINPRSFRLQLVLRMIFISLTIAASLLLWWQSSYIMLASFVSFIFIAQVVALINFVERSNRQLQRFFAALECGDFSQRFEMPQLGESFDELGEAFQRVIDRFRSTRLEREEMAQFANAVVRQVPVGILVADGDGRITLSNKRARKLLGISQLGNIGQLGERAPELLSMLKKPGVTGQRLVPIAVGETRQQLMISTTQFVGQDKPQQIICLQNIRSELDLQEVQAWQDLIRVISHEILNALTPITSLSRSASDALTQVSTDDSSELLNDAAEAVETIARRSQGLLDFVENYRRVARLPTPEPAYVDIGDILEQSARLMEQKFKDHNISLQRNILPRLPTLFADEQQLTQAMINLLHNARDALSEQPQGVILLTAYANHHKQLVVEVADNGCGIAPELLAKVWVPFFTTKGHGSGVGLSLVRQIVLAHRGTVQIQSRPGEGTTVSLLFPL